MMYQPFPCRHFKKELEYQENVLQYQNLKETLRAQAMSIPSRIGLISARAPCDVFDPWVRWERGQVGI